MKTLAELRQKKAETTNKLAMIEKEIKQEIGTNIIQFKKVILDFCNLSFINTYTKDILIIALWRIKSLSRNIEDKIEQEIKEFVLERSLTIKNEIEENYKMLYCIGKLENKITEKYNKYVKNHKEEKSEARQNVYIENKIDEDGVCNIKNINYDIYIDDKIKTFDKNTQEIILNNKTSKKNEDLQINNIESEIFVNLNIIDGLICITDSSTTLLSKNCINTNWNLEPRLLNLFKKDFIFKIDITDLKLNIFTKKLKNVLNVFIKHNNCIQVEEKLSYKNFNATQIAIIDFDSLLSDEFNEIGKKYIKKFMKEMFLCKDLCEEQRGMLISYFFVLNPGLIEIFDWQKYYNCDEFYFFVWVRSDQIKIQN
ncbi:hypothetical protein COBT_000562 [Conglomerata obtusa]